MPISDTWCFTCGNRWAANETPIYCDREVMFPGDQLPRRCPGPLLQLHVVVPEVAA